MILGAICLGNGNGRLDAHEGGSYRMEKSRNDIVRFASSEDLAPGSRQINIVVSNTAKSRHLSVSKSGAIEID